MGFEHKSVLLNETIEGLNIKLDMAEMKAADGVQCYRLMQADAEAHKALMYYALKSNERGFP